LCHRVSCSSNRYFKTVEDAVFPWKVAAMATSLHWRAVKSD
jgi:hypothetical protein